MERFELLVEEKNRIGSSVVVSRGVKQECVYRYQSQQPHLYQVKPSLSQNYKDMTMMTTMNGYEVVEFLDRGHVPITEHSSKTKSVATMAC